MSTNALAEIMAKLDRADTHLDSIEAAVDEWVATGPCELVMDCDTKTREHRFRLRVFEPPPATSLNIPISECVHHMRTALDHIGYRLAVHVGGNPPPNEASSGFPICRDPKHFARSLSNKIGKPKAIPPTMRTALEIAQPYYGGNTPNLTMLRDLHDCDKHRFPPLLAAVGEATQVNIESFTGSGFQGPFLGPLKDGAIILSFTPTPNAIVNMDVRARFDVAFGPGYPGDSAYVLPYLRHILAYIRDTLIPSLTTFL